MTANPMRRSGSWYRCHAFAFVVCAAVKAASAVIASHLARYGSASASAVVAAAPSMANRTIAGEILANVGVSRASIHHPP